MSAEVDNGASEVEQRRPSSPLNKRRYIKKPKRVFGNKRGGSVTKAEKTLVEQYVRDMPREITNGQIMQLANVMGRSTTLVRKIVEGARTKFAESAELYVDAHLQATQGALRSEDYETAAKASQWAMENLAAEGVRVIDRVEKNVGTKVMVGIRLGGLDTVKPAIAVSTDEPDNG